MDREKIEKQARSILSDLGKNYGCVVDIGEEFTYVTPIHKENDLQFAITDNGVNGRDISISLKNLLVQKGYSETFDEGTLIDIRKTLCFVSEDLDREFRENKKEHIKIAERETIYHLTSEKFISFSYLERTVVCECLFRAPVLEGEIHSDRKKLQKIIVGTISKADFDIQQSLYENIVISGTVSTLKGLKERLIKEIIKQMPIEGNPPRRKFSKINVTSALD